jgi:acetylornithine/succinyldiaminopimelate/putrescine aminotransferase/predicted amino acid dehydrogenase
MIYDNPSSHGQSNKYRSALKEKLQALGLDAHYIRAEGDILYQKQGASERAVLDLVGGYGANLLGHFHEQLVAVAMQYFQAKPPVLAQGAISPGLEALNNKLREQFGAYCAILTNTGAETVEAAIKHASLENGKTRCWALHNAYHGKSLGTLPFAQAHNEPFQRKSLPIDFLDPNQPDTWEQAYAHIDEVSFCIVEPIQGEAGVVPLPEQFVDWLNSVTGQHGIPIIVDEVQTGLGRTGSLLAADQIGLRKDYICLSKALGGGIAKIGALLVKEERFVPEFAMLNTSTFSDDGWSVAIANAVLDIISEQDLAVQCAKKGAYWKKELMAVQAAFPEVLKSVRGSGLMLGIEFHAPGRSASNLLRNLAGTAYLGYVIASYLLERHQIRVMPTLSNPNTIRVQPSAYVSKAHLSRFLRGLRSVCERIERADAGGLIGHLAHRKAAAAKDYSHQNTFKHQPPAGKKKVAFLGHFITARDLSLWDASFADWSAHELEHLLDRTAKLLDPVVFDEVNVHSVNGDTTHLSFIGLFLDSRLIESAYRTRDYEWIVDKIRHAASLAEAAGCQVLGLGGYTSILTKNGKRLERPGLTVTTGNSLTVGFGWEAIARAAWIQEVQLREAAVAVVGAGGNIANTYATLLAGEVKRLVLVPRLLQNPKVARLRQTLSLQYPELQIDITDRLDTVKDCEIIVASSNSSMPVLFPEHLSPTTKIICDLAVPSDVAESVGTIWPEIIVLKGGVIQLPRNEDFKIGGIPLPDGHVFACMGETLIMGLDQCKHFPGSVGAVSPAGVLRILALAKQAGFALGGFKEAASY